MPDPSNASTMSAPRMDAADEVDPSQADRWKHHGAENDPEVMPDAWIALLFALLVTVFTVAAAWNWLGA